MTSPFERRDADLLDERIEALLRGEDPSSADVGESRELLMAGTLLAAREELESEISPSTAFASSLRIRLIAEAERLADAARTAPSGADAPAHLSLTGARRRAGSRRPRLLVGLVAGAVMAGTGAAAAVGASSSLPGEALYSIKLGMERLALVGDEPSEAGRERLEQAATRLEEAAALSERGGLGDEALAASTIAAFAARATEGGAALLAAEVDGQEGSAETVRTFAQDSRSRLISLSQTADEDIFTALVTAADTVYALDSQVDAVCPTCAGKAEPLAPFARAAEEASRVLRGLTGADVTVEESARDVAEQVARETPRTKRKVREGGRSGDGSTSGRREGPRSDPEPAAPEATRPSLPVPTASSLGEVPVVGSTLEDVQDVVEESVVREIEEQVGKIGKITEGVTDGVTGDDGLLP